MGSVRKCINPPRYQPGPLSERAAVMHRIRTRSVQVGLLSVFVVAKATKGDQSKINVLFATAVRLKKMFCVGRRE